MENFNFEILSHEPISYYLKNEGIANFRSAIDFLKTNSNKLKELQEIVVQDNEESMDNASKIHSVLASLAVENKIKEIELMMAIFVIDPISFPELEDYFKYKTYSSIALTTSFLKIEGNRYDYSTNKPILEKITKKIVREQRMDPHQSKEWKKKIYEDYIQKWLKRNPEVNYPIDSILEEEKDLIELISS